MASFLEWWEGEAMGRFGGNEVPDALSASADSDGVRSTLTVGAGSFVALVSRKTSRMKRRGKLLIEFYKG